MKVPDQPAEFALELELVPGPRLAVTAVRRDGRSASAIDLKRVTSLKGDVTTLPDGRAALLVEAGDALRALPSFLHSPTPLTQRAWDLIDLTLEARSDARNRSWVPVSDPMTGELVFAQADRPGADPEEAWAWLVAEGEGARSLKAPDLSDLSAARYQQLHTKATLWGERLRLHESFGIELAFRLTVPRTRTGRWKLEPRVQVCSTGKPAGFVPSGTSLPGDGSPVPGSPVALARLRDALLSAIERTQDQAERDYARARLDLVNGVLAEWGASLMGGPLEGGPDEVDEVLTAHDRLLASGFTVLAPEHWKPVQLEALGTLVGSSARTLSDLRLSAGARVEGKELSQEEIAELLASGADFAFLDGAWRRLERSGLDRLEALRAKEGQDLSPTEVLELEIDHVDASAVSGWVAQALEGSWKPRPAQLVEDGTTADLRAHQKSALAWLVWLEDNRLGGILADDMGLGKTLTTLALVEHDHDGPTLVVCPTTLVTNWAREAARFTPGLTVHVHRSGALDPSAGDADLVLAPYGVVLRETASFRAVPWRRLVVDEAQTIKNPATATTRAVNSIKAHARHALTGTPVENHLGELWSLMELANPGLLGSRQSFTERFVARRAGASEVEALRRTVAPFLLRRKKSDPGVIEDLPEKITTREDCALSARQATLYQAKADSMRDKADPGTRMARVLAGLTALKQICVHPKLYEKGLTADHLAGDSGKIERLRELLVEIVDEGGAALVFTQYAEVLAPLQQHLSSVLGREVLVLEGSMSPKARQAAVDAFSQEGGAPVMLLSLRAGGTGLNLVRANHVIHLDRWWNPAVEDQASDRAWRIGQTRAVQVHNLVCPGTLEERIERILTDKRGVAEEVVASSGKAIVDMDDDELNEFVSLDLAEAVIA